MARSRIPTPFNIRFQRWRERFGPVLALLLCVPITGWMWARHAGVIGEIGEVLAVRVELAAPADGTIVAVGDRYPRPFDTVRAGELIARLDDRPVLAALATLQARIGVTQGELAAETARWRLGRGENERGQEITRQRLLIEIQELRLDILDRRAAIEFDQIELRRVEHAIDGLRQLVDRGSETDFTLTQERLRRDALGRRIEEQRAAMRTAETQLTETLERLEAIPEGPAHDLEDWLAPIRAAFRVHEAEIRELELVADGLQIRVPIDGMISAVHARPGEHVRAGLPLVTIASEQADTIVTYIRERNPVPLEIGGVVELRPVHHRGAPVRGAIDQIGVQVELVPEHQRTSPGRMEWGLPVRISMPEGLDVRAGELVRVVFK
ncbi:MAG: HlyD family efflux transporter periplasmic adaptor subunit [Phycisphaerales bacterium]|nr:HlyD family efflux transporter periplasmic adaptor subunit [Planctomycetota bacterium]MCH8507256.1 HlyD family efflux transporter periplasmic adaptor subunit [Phycisphaerales bacterium]